MAGQGTIGIEILEDLPTVDMVLVPAGGGGLLAGVAACIKQINPRVQIVGVQAEGAPAIYNSFKEKNTLLPILPLLSQTVLRLKYQVTKLLNLSTSMQMML